MNVLIAIGISALIVAILSIPAYVAARFGPHVEADPLEGYDYR